MKRLLATTLAFSAIGAVPLVSVLFAAGQPAYAGLGDADTEVSKEFDAWCGKRKNDCKITFPTSSRMEINEKDGITRDQLQSYQCGSTYRQMGLKGWDYWEYSCLIKYQEDGVDRSGKILFVNTGSFSDFQDALSVFCGPKCRTLGPSIKIESD